MAPQIVFMRTPVVKLYPKINGRFNNPKWKVGVQYGINNRALNKKGMCYKITVVLVVDFGVFL
jgi:hypothetical protein